MGDMALIAVYKDLLSTVQRRTIELKKQGRTLEEATAAIAAELQPKYPTGGARLNTRPRRLQRSNPSRSWPEELCYAQLDSGPRLEAPASASFLKVTHRRVLSCGCSYEHHCSAGSFRFHSCSSAPCSTDAIGCVSEVYRHILERGVDPGAQNWARQLANRQMTVKELVRQVAKSQEHMQRFGQTESCEGQPFERGGVARMFVTSLPAG